MPRPSIRRWHDPRAGARLPKILDALFERLSPEAAYFWTHEGKRGGVIIFDLKHQSDIPSIAEPLFMGTNATVEFSPVMNADDLKAGLEKARKAF